MSGSGRHEREFNIRSRGEYSSRRKEIMSGVLDFIIQNGGKVTHQEIMSGLTRFMPDWISAALDDLSLENKIKVAPSIRNNIKTYTAL